jgi:cytochrome d ubiquinol oxidase subunit I
LDNLLAARIQMGFTLGFHMLFAAFGVGFPMLVLAAEGIALRGGPAHYLTLAKTWGKANALLFAVGAVSGTALAFELGLLWPGFMLFSGSTIGAGFATEAFAFFLEAIFIGLYLYGWNRLTRLGHWLAGIPIVIGGIASAALVVSVDAWMQHPVGAATLLRAPAAAAPLAMLFGNPHWPVMALHATIACFAATGFTLASVYAYGMLRGRRDEVHKAGLKIAMVLATGAAILMPLTGDMSGKAVAAFQPTKLAAMESQFRTETAAPLRIGGLPDPKARTVRYALEIPGGLSWLAYGSGSAKVQGLDQVATSDWPDVPVTHVSFQLMVGAGTLMVLIALYYWWNLRHRGRGLTGSLLRTLVAGGPLAFLALETGWVVTEVGRQPWVVYGVQRTADAVTPVHDLFGYLALYALLYLLLGTTVLWLLRRVEREAPALEEAA